MFGKNMLESSLIATLAIIEEDVEAALNKIKDGPGGLPEGAINWGDLHVVYAAFVITKYDNKINVATEVLIEEADPAQNELRTAIIERLPIHLKDICVRFEW